MTQRNILVRQDGIIVIADFGYTRVLHSEKRKGTMPESVIRAYRYLAPEVIDRDARFTPTQQTDTYALALTIVELGTGEKPYRDVENANNLLTRVIPPENYRPEKEKSLGYLGEESTEKLWKCLEGMWRADARSRLEVAKVRQFVESLRKTYGQSVPRQSVSVRDAWEVASRTNRFLRSHQVHLALQWKYSGRSHLVTMGHGKDTRTLTLDIVRGGMVPQVPSSTPACVAVLRSRPRFHVLRQY
jgi:serine/threonine protein kinase